MSPVFTGDVPPFCPKMQSRGKGKLFFDILSDYHQRCWAFHIDRHIKRLNIQHHYWLLWAHRVKILWNTLFCLKMRKVINFELYMTPCHLTGFVHDQNTSLLLERWHQNGDVCHLILLWCKLQYCQDITEDNKLPDNAPRDTFWQFEQKLFPTVASVV